MTLLIIHSFIRIPEARLQELEAALTIWWLLYVFHSMNRYAVNHTTTSLSPLRVMQKIDSWWSTPPFYLFIYLKSSIAIIFDRQLTTFRVHFLARPPYSCTHIFTHCSARQVAQVMRSGEKKAVEGSGRLGVKHCSSKWNFILSSCLNGM